MADKKHLTTFQFLCAIYGLDEAIDKAAELHIPVSEEEIAKVKADREEYTKAIAEFFDYICGAATEQLNEDSDGTTD